MKNLFKNIARPIGKITHEIKKDVTEPIVKPIIKPIEKPINNVILKPIIKPISKPINDIIIKPLDKGGKIIDKVTTDIYNNDMNMAKKIQDLPNNVAKNIKGGIDSIGNLMSDGIKLVLGIAVVGAIGYGVYTYSNIKNGQPVINITK